MGHKAQAGYEASGARGLVKPMKPLTAAQVYAAFESGEQVDVRELARPHRAKAIKTLVRLTGRKMPPSVQASAAKSLLEFSDGKAAQIEPVRSDRSITINIHRLYAGGGPETKVIDAIDVSKAVAGEVIESLGLPDTIPIVLEKKE